DCIDDTWIKRGRYCYKATYQPRVSFDDARAECRSLSTAGSQSDLVSLGDLGEALFVAHLILSDQTVDGSPVYGCWIGLERNQKNADWKWLDGNPSNFTNWGDPPNESAERSCAYIKVKEDLWGSTHLSNPIGWFLRGRVCKTKVM
ncbi:hypothetical protein CAPTEDRAFT_195373, partial [Capitella teleta]